MIESTIRQRLSLAEVALRDDLENVLVPSELGRVSEPMRPKELVNFAILCLSVSHLREIQEDLDLRSKAGSTP